jgi:hypothetical protein
MVEATRDLVAARLAIQNAQLVAAIAEGADDAIIGCMLEGMSPARMSPARVSPVSMSGVSMSPVPDDLTRQD